MKRLLSLAACIMIAVLSYAHDFVVDGIYYDITSSSEPYTVAVTFKGTGSTSYSNEYTGEITIPEAVTYNGTTYSVTSIGDYAFSHCTGLTSVTIPNNVTSIANYAFFNCSGLTSVTIGNSVTTIGASTFNGCSNLTSVTINSNAVVSKNYTSYWSLGGIFGEQVKEYVLGDGVTSIGDYAFSHCTGLPSVTIPNSVTTIGNHAFEGCTGLTSITIPESVTSIGGYAFFECSGLTSVTIPESVTNIAIYAFYGCNALTSVTIPESVTSIGDHAFEGCTGLTSVTIPESVTSIGYGVFWSCSNLTSVTINSNAIVSKNDSFLKDIFGAQVEEYVLGDGVTSIGNNAFYGCFGLTSVTIPESVTNIAIYAFYGCSALTSVTIPESVTSIGDHAFEGCTGLTSFTIPESVTTIGASTFYGCSNLTSVTINSNAVVSKNYTSYWSLGGIFGAQVEEYVLGDAVTSIGDYAFFSCHSLTSVTIPNSVTSIGYYAFASCGGLTSVTIPNAVTSIGDYAFASCGGLTSIVVEEGNSYYDSRNNCNAIIETASNTLIAGCQNTVIPEGVTSIGYGAFEQCSGLTSVTIPESVTNIAIYAFYGCSALTYVTIPNSVTSIGYYAFASCGGLTSIVVEESNSYYDSRNNCNAIIETASNTLIAGCQNTVIPESVTSIGYGAFFECSGLTSITIPNSVTSIGDGAFYGCFGLTSIISYIKEPFDTKYCWYGVDKSIPLYVPAGTKEKYQQTIGWSDFTNIIELGAETLEPAEEAEEVDLSQLPDELELNGVVYNNTYYALDAENGDGADSENGCVIINSITTDEAVNSIVGKDISDESVKDAFRGIIFMVPAGSGIVSVTAETNGFKTLVVKIGSQEAQTFTLAERETVKIAYTVDKPTYVYVYAGETEAPLAKGMEGTEKEEGCVKVYSYKWESAEPTGMESFTSASSPKSEESQYYYTIDGQRITGKPTKIGIYINGGKKVVVK